MGPLSGPCVFPILFLTIFPHIPYTPATLAFLFLYHACLFPPQDLCPGRPLCLKYSFLGLARAWPLLNSDVTPEWPLLSTGSKGVSRLTPLFCVTPLCCFFHCPTLSGLCLICHASRLEWKCYGNRNLTHLVHSYIPSTKNGAHSRSSVHVC